MGVDYFFFFQAEDGIRDGTVTGVQTCALPILATNCDWRLAWHWLTLANSPRSDGMLPMSVVGEIEASGGLTIPDWALHWVHGVYNYYRFAGDRDVVKSLLPSAER